MKYKFLLSLIVGLFLISLVSAQIDQTRKDRLEFGYVLDVTNVSTDPTNLMPGGTGVLKMKLKNNAQFPIYDIRVQVNLPSGVSFVEDTSKRKITSMYGGEVKEISYKIVALPSATEGVYTASFSVDYLNHVATERNENDSFGIIIKGEPKIFVEIDSSNLYEGSLNGDITINFVNNNPANIRFLTVELSDTNDYEVISSAKKYVGDLDSDDFQSVDFKVRLKNPSKELNLPLKMQYRDSMNQEYDKEVTLNLPIKSTSEMGVKGSLITWPYILGGVIVVIIIIILLRRRKVKKREGKS